MIAASILIDRPRRLPPTVSTVEPKDGQRLKIASTPAGSTTGLGKTIDRRQMNLAYRPDFVALGGSSGMLP